MVDDFDEMENNFEMMQNTEFSVYVSVPVTIPILSIWTFNDEHRTWIIDMNERHFVKASIVGITNLSLL